MAAEKDIKVSVLCITYNQADFIAETIESFLMQETSFDYEILIHDDASSDGTAEIVREYAERYPDRITAVLQEENQLSKQVPIIEEFLLPLVKGKYIAFCEGDDCWLRNDKLQRQYDYMEAHPDCSACAHQAIWSDGADDEKVLGMMGYGDEKTDLSADDLIYTWWLPTASICCKTQDYTAFHQDWSLSGPVGDFPLVIYLADKSYLHYDPMIAARYRYKVPGSYSAQTDQAKLVKRCASWITMCEEIDQATAGRHHDELVVIEKRNAREIYDRLGLKALIGKTHGIPVGSFFTLHEKLHFVKTKLLDR